MTTRFRKAVVCTTLFSVTGVTVAAGCPAVADSVWQAGMTAAGTTVGASIAAMTTAVGIARTINLETMVSAIKVATSQIKTSAENSNAMVRSAKQASANFAVEISSRKALMKTLSDYDPATGQGYDPCGELTRSKNVAVAIGEAANDMQDKVIREIDAAPGRYVANQGSTIAERLRSANGTYCTADESKAGLCQAPGVMAGKDVDATNFFTSYASGSAEDAAKSQLLNHLYGLPDVAISAATAKTPVGQAYMEQKRSKDAIASVSQASLKTIQSWTASRGGHGGDTQSVLDALSSKIGTYSGGANYDTWAQTLASQSQRGLLVELAKMGATDLYVQYLRYQAGEREEALVASRLALLASDGTGSADAAVRNADARAKVGQ